ncbi:uncharacterized protein LOC101852693 [Aplysia californica]|uniref:Uncharacterized protein LOC101852693 n=1 Tax=Aplysia californica TaxID=6500 RepID=A0ABM0ZZW6_APLCA|nr:uncharacterized protein LOC101852693 [Aplysia californica]
MASTNRLRLYDINANKRSDLMGPRVHLTSPPIPASPTLISPAHSTHSSVFSPSPSPSPSPHSSMFSPSSLSSPPPRSPRSPSPIPSPFEPPVAVETRHDIEYTRAPDTFPCGHVLCHNCVRKFMRLRQRSGYSRCPVCHRRVDADAPLQAMGIPTTNSSSSSNASSGYASDTPSSPGCSFTESGGGRGGGGGVGASSRRDSYPPPSDPTPISLLNNFDEIVQKFNGINGNLRRLKDESVQSKSMGMTFTNTQCHLCMENHGTLRVVQEYNRLAVRHERPNAWSNYFYRLQQGKVVTEFYSQVNSSCICVPCTYRELKQQNLPELGNLPDVNPQHNTQICLAEVGKIVARNSAPIRALQGKNVIEIDHTIRLRERADHFNFLDTTDQIERMVRQQEETLLGMASKQIRDTGRLYHVKESNEVEFDMDETEV